MLQLLHKLGSRQATLLGRDQQQCTGGQHGDSLCVNNRVIIVIFCVFADLLVAVASRHGRASGSVTVILDHRHSRIFSACTTLGAAAVQQDLALPHYHRKKHSVRTHCLHQKENPSAHQLSSSTSRTIPQGVKDLTTGLLLWAQSLTFKPDKHMMSYTRTRNFCGMLQKGQQCACHCCPSVLLRKQLLRSQHFQNSWLPIQS